MKSVLSCVVMILSLLHASGTFEVTSKKVKNTLSPDAGVRFRSKTKAPTFQNVPAKFLTNGAIDRWPEMCFDKLELVDGVCKPQNYDDPEPWDPEEDLPSSFLIQAEASKSKARACERLLDTDTTSGVEASCQSKSLYRITDDCKEFPDQHYGTGFQVMEESVKNDLQIDSNYEVTAETISRCAPINLFNQYSEDLPVHHLHYENQNKRVCYLAQGADDSKFKASVCAKLHIETVDAGTVTFKCGVTCALTPAEGMSVFDFNYNAADGSISDCHLGHGVKNLVMG